MTALVDISRQLSTRVSKLDFAAPVAYTYNPLAYAAESHEMYLRRYGDSKKFAVLLGMNPGPFGMAQTGVPFGEIAAVRDWMGIDAEVGKPLAEHPKRPILGFDCPRSEVSGRRLWGWAAERFGEASTFFDRFFVVNYCPLVFMEEGGRNHIPEKLPASERKPLFEACDDALRQSIEALDPEYVIGVGAFAKKCANRVVGSERKIAQILHPSPASPKANRGWAEQAEKELDEQGIAWR